MPSININLLPWREELKEQKKQEFMYLLLMVVLLVGGIILLIHFVIDRQVHFQNEDNRYLKEEIKMLDQQIQEIDFIDKEKKQLLQKMKVIQLLQASRPEAVKLFDGMTRLVPQGLYLSNLSRQDDRIMLEGKAESNTRVSALMRNIEASKLLSDPRLSLIQAVDEQKKDDKTTRQPDRLIGFYLEAREVENVIGLVPKTGSEKEAQRK